MKFIVNHNTQVYHRPDCHCVPQILKENMMETESKPIFQSPCSKCRPELEMVEGIDLISFMEVQE